MFENQPKIIINNKKALLCSRAFLQKSDHHSDQQNSVDLSQNNLLKFFPKYIHELRIKVETRSVISKVKRVKILHAFQGYQNRTQSKNLKRTLLYNKEKLIQTIYDDKDSKPDCRCLLAFTGLKSLKILYESYSDSALKRICQYVRGLYHLEHLQLKMNSERSLRIISTVIDPCKRLLESLKTLRINCKWGTIWQRNPEDDYALFESLSKNKNILKSTTRLELGYLNDETFCELFENVLASCPKLTFLLFESDYLRANDTTQESQARDLKPLKSRYLQALGNLGHLHTVNITCTNIFTFMRDFTLPLSIQNVKISFSSFLSAMTFVTTSNNQDFREQFVNFCQKWSHLKNLKTLNITLSQLSDLYNIGLAFLKSWLGKICNVQHLELELSSEVGGQSHWSEFSKHEGTLDLSVFLQSIQHLKNTLQTLVISDSWLIYSTKNLPQQPFDFPHLQKFILKGFMRPEDINLSHLFQVNLEGLLAIKSAEPFDLIADGFDFDSMDSFVDFIKSFDHERNHPRRTVEMKMKVYVRSQASRTSFLDKLTRYFTLEARGLRVKVEVASDGKFEANCEPKFLLKDNLNFLVFKD